MNPHRINTDSVSTMDNPLTDSTRFTTKSIATIIGCSNGRTGITRISSQSLTSIDSQISSIESRIYSHESILVSSVKSNAKVMFQQMSSAPIKPAKGEKPDGDP